MEHLLWRELERRITFYSASTFNLKYQLKLFCGVFIGLMTLSLPAQEATLMTYNIRYDNKNDRENNWEDRKLKMVRLFEHYQPGVFGIQEGLHHQVNYLDSCLENYTHIGVGRDDGKKRGEYTAIYFDTTKFQLKQQSTFWLSETPDEVSKGWDAALERICTYGLFSDLKGGKQFWVFNTHFDHKGKLARQNSSLLILLMIDHINKEDFPVILMGDFNVQPNSLVVNHFNTRLSDAYDISQQPPYGPVGTFNGFDLELIMERRIDYIFVDKFKVLSFAHIDDRLDNNRHISDHLAVIAKVIFD